MAAERFDTYGFPSADLEEAHRFLQTRLGFELRLRDSSYRGTYYALRLPDDGGIQLYADAGDGVLLELSRLADMDAVRDRLLQAPSPAVLLRSRTIDVPDDDA
jgi:catechol 2,3-dioxygenase-like lactoylglutathione lyase family enzyme